MEEIGVNKVPLQLFICKVSSRCNLNCDYCYVYNHIDQTWKNQPLKMSLDTASVLSSRINEHLCNHNLNSVEIVFHGGEPFLLKLEYLDQICNIFTLNLPNIDVKFRVQTNGTIFDEKSLDFCIKWNMKIGLSLDGPPQYNSLHRFDHKQKPLSSNIQQTLSLLTSEKGRPVWSGFLTVINLNFDPILVYNYLKSFNPKSIEFLLPLGHYDMLPFGKSQDLSDDKYIRVELPNEKIYIDSSPYADWLLKIFYQWYSENNQINIRRFRDVIALILGSRYSTEEWGMQPVDFAVVEANGEMQAVDTLKVTYPGAADLGLNIFENSFDEMLNSPKIKERQNKCSNLCQVCLDCKFLNICGGGYFPHRYSSKNGFQNPSIYCADLKKLISNIYSTVSDSLKYAG